MIEFLPVAVPAPAAYDALRSSAARVDRSDRGRLLVEGGQAAAMLTGLVTNDVLALAPGEGLYAAAPTPKGKILADCRILCVGDGRLLVDSPPRAAAALRAMLGKFLPPRLAKARDVGGATGCLGVYGPRAASVLAPALGLEAATLSGLAPHGHVPVPSAVPPALVVRSPWLGGMGFDVIAAPEAIAELSERLSEVPVADAAAATVARIEAGIPEWGLDMDDGTIPQEANFDALGAISYTKGCYTGQEVVARVHFRGHVNRHLRGLTGPAALPSGASVVHGETEVGEVRSSGVSPRSGAVALAMVRREVPDGASVTVRDAAGGAVEAVVTPLPMPEGA